MTTPIKAKHILKQGALIFVLTTLVLVFCGTIARGQTAAELQSQISKKNADIASLQKEIENYQQQLKAIGNEKNTLSRAIKELDLSAKKLAADIRVTQGKIDAANLKLQELGMSIVTTTSDISDNKTVLRRLISEMRTVDTISLVEVIAEKDSSMTDLWHYVDHSATVSSALRQRVGTLTTEKHQLEGHRNEVEATRAELAALKDNLANQKKVVDSNTNDKNKLLKDTKNKESNYAALLAQNLARKEAFENELRDYESKLKYVLDPKSLPSSHTLGWPVDKVIITQLFGKTAASGRLYASGTHNGVDFGIPLGTPVRAVADGTVLGSGNTDLTCPRASYGNWILIGHGNGLTSVFGHLSLVSAKTGAQVKRGDIVAYSGSTGYSTGPHLHLTIFAADAVEIKQFPSKSCNGRVYTQPVAPTSAYLDPMLYLPSNPR